MVWENELIDWRKRREDELRAPFSWLSLSALIWLDDKASVLGGAGASLSPWRRLPRFGCLEPRSSEGHWQFHPEPDLSFRSWNPVLPGTQTESSKDSKLTLLSDDRNGAATLLEVHDLRMCIIRRRLAGEPRQALRVWDSRSPRRTEQSIEWFEADERWRKPGRFISEIKNIEVPDALGSTEFAKSVGSVTFDHADRTFSLVCMDGGNDGLFIIFRDVLSNSGGQGGVYPSARYLTVEKPGDDGMVELDFNRAVSPPCAYSSFATCPFAPDGNHMDITVPAGERWVKNVER